MLRKIVLAGALAVSIAAMPNMALARDHGNGGGWKNDHRDQDDKDHRNRGNQMKRGHHRDSNDNQNYRRNDDWRSYGRYDYNRQDSRYGGYYADRYYRDGRYYQPRHLSYNDRIYRGQNGQYYCRRSDGTTGLIIGALGGGLLGNAIAPGGSKTLGTILGGGAGALIGRSLDRDGARCR